MNRRLALALVASAAVALGDSYTAGFGYFDDGVEWDDLFACADTEETAEVRNNPCSSNSMLRGIKGPLEFAPDYGVANQVSWAAQVASALGVTRETSPDLYANLAVSGSTAREWAEDKLVFEQLGGPPGNFTSETDCSGRAKAKDGTDVPSNQSTLTQELFGEEYAESGWCAGPPWTIPSDTGVHPNVAGYAELARVALAGLGRN